MRTASKSRNHKRATLLAAAIGAGALFTHYSEGATFTWDAGGGNTNWTTAGNWTGGVNTAAGTAPSGTGYDVLIGTGGSTAVVNSNQVINGLTFNRAGDFTVSGSSSLTLNSVSAAAPGTTGRTYTISAPLTLAVTNIWNVDATLGSTTLTVSSVISDGTSTFGLTKNGNGLLILSNSANTYKGTTSINSGTLEISTLDDTGGSGIGNAGNGLTLNGGFLRFVSSNSGSTARAYTLGTSGGGLDASASSSSDTLTLSGVMTASGSTGSQTFTLTGSNTGNNTVSGAIVNGTNTNVTHLVKDGTGRWQLNAANTYTGSTTINDGTLAYGASNVLSDSSAVTINGANAVLDLGSSHTDTIGGLSLVTGTVAGPTSALTLNSGSYELRSGTVEAALNGSAGLYKSTSSTVALEGANGFTGQTRIIGGILSLDAGSGALTGTSGIYIGAGGSLRLNNLTSSTAIDDRVKNTADVNLTSGTFEYVGRGSTLPTSQSDESVKRFVFEAGSSTLTIGNSLRSSGSADQSSLTITDATDGLARNSGATFRFVDDSADAFVNVTKHNEVNGIVGGWAIYDNANFLALSGSNTGSMISASGYETTVTQSNWASADNVKLSGSAGNFTVAANKTINSLIEASTTPRSHTINSGVTLTLDSGGMIITGTGHTINGPGALTAGSLGGYELVVHTTNLSTGTMNAVISNNGTNAVTLTKSGSGSLRLYGANTYSGPTYVAEGTLSLVSASNNIASSSIISVQSGATLDVSGITGGFKLGTNQKLKGTGSVAGNVTADAVGSTIAPGNSPGKLTFTGNLTLNSNATYEVQIGGTGTGTGTAGIDFDQIVVTGSSRSVTLGSAQLKILPMPGIVTGQTYRIVTGTSGATVVASNIFKNLTQNLNAGGPYTQGNVTFNIDYGYGANGYVDVTFSAVPEPTSLSVLAIGACGLLQRRRRASKR